MTLVQRLQQIQQAHGLKDGEFAKRLGIQRVSWWNIRTLNKGIGPRVMATIIREFPDLKPFVVEYILESNPPVVSNDTREIAA